MQGAPPSTAYDRNDPRNLSNREPLNATVLVVLCLVFAAVLVAVVVLGLSLNGIANGGKAGCVLSYYDNYQRGFGIDNGSCVVAQRFAQPSTTERVLGCSAVGATYTDLGGVDGGYRYVDATGDDDDDAYSSTLRFAARDGEPDTPDVLCFTFTEFNVVGGDAACSRASLNITGAADARHDGVYCDEAAAAAVAAPLPLNERICTRAGGAHIEFNFTTDGSTDGTGWVARVECGAPGCTQRAYDNFDAAAELDDGTCRSTHPSSAATADIVQVCGDGDGDGDAGDTGVYYDAGGPAGDYANREFVQRAFNSTDAAKRVCFDFLAWDVQGVCGGAGAGVCCDSLAVDESDTGHDGPHCNGATSLQNERVCSKPGEPIYFRFSSDAAVTAAGWGAQVSCESA